MAVAERWPGAGNHFGAERPTRTATRPDDADNCPTRSPRIRTDADGDGVGHASIRSFPVPTARDGYPDTVDNCPLLANEQTDPTARSSGDAWRQHAPGYNFGQPIDPTTGTTPATITFGNVQGGGETTVTTTQQGSPPPNAFRLGNPPLYYDIHTTATFTGSAKVCIRYNAGAFGNENKLRLLHRDATQGGSTSRSLAIPRRRDVGS